MAGKPARLCFEVDHFSMAPTGWPAPAAGCVLASRPSAAPDGSVVLLEAGGRDLSVLDIPSSLSASGTPSLIEQHVFESTGCRQK